MEVYTTEQEQLDELKKWWKENAKAVIAGIVIGVSVLLAYWVWRDYVRTQGEGASAEYQLLIGELEQGDAAAGIIHGEQLLKQYPDTSYAVFAALAMAKLALDKADTNVARAHLEWALEHAEEDSVQHIARLRLARLMLDTAQMQAALKLVSLAEPGSFLSAYEEVKGDAYLALGKTEQARTAYQRALDALGEEDVEVRKLLKMKLQDLGVKADTERAA